MEEQVKQLQELIAKMDNKEFNLYFFCLDTKGNPTAGIANIYEHVKLLNEIGYKAYIMHEKNDYKLRGDENGMGISDWLGEEYAALPHVSIEGQNLNITPVDFVIVPEIFSTLMDQVKDFPCRKIVFSQNYDYLLELLPIGKRWDADFHFTHSITTSTKQAQYLKTLFPALRTFVIPVSIPEYFTKNTKPKQPIVAILTRNQGDAAKIAKAFYLQFPIYKWITFKEFRGIPRKQFAEDLKNCCLSVWVDDPSAFGTFPLESMEVGTPVIGKMPNMIPEWMETVDENGNPGIKNNGVWTNTTINIPELIATYIKVWLEDNVPQDLLNSMQDTTGKYSPKQQKAVLENIYTLLIQERKQEFANLLAQSQSQLENQNK